MEFIDRTAENPNRFKITYEDSGSSSYAKIELADNPIEAGTPLNRASFETMQSDLLSGKKGIHSVSAGGTGANNKEQALVNLGAASANEHTILIFDKLNYAPLSLNDNSMGTSASSLLNNIVLICETIGNRLASNSRVFMLRTYLSDSVFPNLRDSILKKINQDVGTSYSGYNLQIEIKGVKQKTGTKDITVVIDRGDTQNRFECFLNNSNAYSLSEFVETTPHEFNKPLLTGASLSEGDTKTISNASGYNLFAIKMRCVMGYEATEAMVLAYANPSSYVKNLKGANGDFYFEGTINTDNNKLTVYGASCSEQPAYVVNIIGVM